MREIDITTSHNIVVRYPLASLLQRILASIIDLGVMILMSLLISLLFSLFQLETLLFVLIFLVFAFYHLVFELWNGGQSLGKQLLNIQVISLSGNAPTAQEIFQRWIYRLIDITSTFGGLAAVFISTSPYHQRIGDLMAGTSVIMKRPDKLLSIKHIDRIDQRDHVVTYPEIASYDESRILLIKEAVERHRRHSNDSTRKVIKRMTQLIEQELHIEKTTPRDVDFLTTLVLDYVALTR